MASLSITVVKEVGEAAENSASSVMGLVGSQLGVSLNPLTASSIDIHEDKIDMKSNIGDDPYTFQDLRPNMHIQSDSGNNGASYNIDQNKLKYNLKSKSPPGAPCLPY